MFDAIADALARGDRVELRKFGSFTARQRRPLEGRDPRTGTPVAVPAKKAPFFRMAVEMRKLINSF